MLSALSLLALTASAVAQSLGTCNGDTYPNPSDCATIMKDYPIVPKFVHTPPKGEGCEFLNPPSGVSPDSLNCRICVAATTSDQEVIYGDIVDAYTVIKTDCFPHKAGGTSTYERAKVTVSNNPDYSGNPERRDLPDIQRRRAGPILSTRSDDVCTNGNGKLTLLLVDKNVNAPRSYWKEITRLANGGQFTYQKSDSRSVGVDVSVSVEAGFFDLFSTTFSVSLSETYTVQSTEGVSVTNNCSDNKEAIVYLVPQVDAYYTECQETKKEINAFKPGSLQNTYTYECLG